MLSKVLEEQAEAKCQYDPIGEEPVLEKYFHDELLKICGRMGLAGAPPPVVRGVLSDVHRVAQAMVGTVRKAHRVLWDDVLPEVAGSDLKVNPTKPHIGKLL